MANQEKCLEMSCAEQPDYEAAGNCSERSGNACDGCPFPLQSELGWLPMTIEPITVLASVQPMSQQQSAQLIEELRQQMDELKASPNRLELLEQPEQPERPQQPEYQPERLIDLSACCWNWTIIQRIVSLCEQRSAQRKLESPRSSPNVDLDVDFSSVCPEQLQQLLGITQRIANLKERELLIQDFN